MVAYLGICIGRDGAFSFTFKLAIRRKVFDNTLLCLTLRRTLFPASILLADTIPQVELELRVSEIVLYEGMSFRIGMVTEKVRIAIEWSRRSERAATETKRTEVQTFLL